MHRMGQMPLVKYGVQIVVAHQEHQAEEGKGAIPSRRQRPIRPRPDAQESTENQGGAFDPTINPPNSKPLNEPRKPPMTNLERMVSTVSLKTFENFFVNYQKSCSKLWNGMGVTFTKTFTNFPERMYHGAERLGKGCSKMADRTVEGFKKIFGDDASPK